MRGGGVMEMFVYYSQCFFHSKIIINTLPKIIYGYSNIFIPFIIRMHYFLNNIIMQSHGCQNKKGDFDIFDMNWSCSNLSLGFNIHSSSFQIII